MSLVGYFSPSVRWKGWAGVGVAVVVVVGMTWGNLFYVGRLLIIS